jgi:SAM-dependent methyltransferase
MPRLRRDELIAQRDRVVAEYGPWTSHSIHLGEDVWTGEPGENWRVGRFRRIMKDFGFASLTGLRVLDLACLEGLFAIEYARQGAETVGIEGRRANIEKAKYARDVLGVSSCELFQDDVRNLSREKYGTFDIVLCAGILYHLDTPDMLIFIKRISDVCERLAIIDTHVALETLRRNPFDLGKLHNLTFEGCEYEGRYFTEHCSIASPQEKESRLWASLDNHTSFWLTRRSLFNAIERCGFGAVYDNLRDIKENGDETDRVVFVAVK